MKSILTRCVATCVAAAAMNLAYAQTQASPPPAPHAPTHPGTSADELLRDADDVVRLIDAGHFQTLWNDAAPFVKARYDLKSFSDDTRMARQAVGSVKRRGWAAVTRIIYTGEKNVPDGLYANVDYATTQTSGKVVFEKVSFRLERDGRWHLTGYVPRITQGPIPGAQ